MKKIFITVLLATMSTGLFAQLTKGALAFTGTFGLGGSKQENTQTNLNTGVTSNTLDQKTKNLVFLPGVSYFVSDKLEAGIAFIVSKNTQINNYPQPNLNRETKSENPFTGFGIFGNYYFINQEKFHMYAGLQLGVGSGTGNVTTTQYSGNSTVVETKNNASTFGLNGGFIYFVKSNIALNGSLGLLSFNKLKTSSTSNNNTNKTDSGNWAFGVNGVIINIGVKVFLFKKA